MVDSDKVQLDTQSLKRISYKIFAKVKASKIKVTKNIVI
jgi:hypothetical protein